ncbi:MAG: serine/threonine-protein kinase, partial [Planctomycetota bacterium]
KVINKEVSADAAFVERFAREAKTLAKLSHPNIVTIFDYGQSADGTAYLILEFIDGINLREAISSGSVGSDEALEVVSTICGALEYAHSKGVVHRDIKPENILLGEDGTLKVADFGIAKMVDDSVRAPTLTATRQVLGSLHYLAPEHLEAPDKVDHRVDLYALGVIFYELLTGQLPLGRYDRPSQVRHRVDQRLDSIVLKTLDRKPEQRYQNASELDADLDQVAISMKQDPETYAKDGSESPQEVPERSAGSVSVPFTCDTSDGMSAAIGVVQVRDDLLRAEFRIRNVFGYLSSKMHVVEIPRSRLTRVELLPGFFRSRLVITADTISTLGEFPNAETGRAELKIQRDDEGCALEVAQALGFNSIQTVTRHTKSGPIEWANQPSDSVRIFFGVSMIFCGLLNGGTLGVSEYLANDILTDGWQVIASIAAAMFLGPLCLLQIVTGMLSLIGRVRALGMTTCIISMIPFTPIWVFSFPVSLWAYRGFKETQVDEPSSPATGSWGATTMMLIRESRWATTTGIFSTTSALLVLGGIVAFQFGYYPSEMQYRIVDTRVDRSELEDSLLGRLESYGGFISLEVVGSEQPTGTLTITAWQACHDEVAELLSVTGVPKLVWLEPNGSETDSTATVIPVVGGIDTTAFLTVEQSLGAAIQVIGDPLDLTPQLVGKISDARGNEGNQIVIELTPEGREQLEKLGDLNSSGGLGLVIGGLVEGVAESTAISPKNIRFELSATSIHNRQSIVAGIRGPELPSQLELLD